MLPIILLSHPEDATRKNEAIRLGAQEFLITPLEEGHLEVVIKRHLIPLDESAEAEILSDDIQQISEEEFFVCASPIMRKLRTQAELLAQTNAPVLIQGESGSGKATVARLIHNSSVRSGFRFKKVNCRTLPADLLESELFGSERSCSNGSVRTKLGQLELCERGTVLISEVADAPASVQAEVLQVLQKKQFSRPGSHTPVKVDVRMLATMSGNVEQALAEGKLREDLYYLLSTFTVQVPPLRKRRDELPFLLHHFMHYLAKHYGLPSRSFAPTMLDACRSYAWPGNLKELEDFVKRCLVMGDEDADFGQLVQGSDSQAHDATLRNSGPTATWPSATTSGERVLSLKSLVQSVKLEAERNAITGALEKTGWNRKAAARLLKVSYRTLLYKIEQYQMSSPEHHASRFLGNGYTGRNGAKGSGQ
jgi:DNA-binding NtrC family response regulator